MKSDLIRAEIAKQKADRAAAKIKGLERQLAQSIAALERVRKTKRVHITLGTARPRLKGDRLRMLIPDVHGAKQDKNAVRAALQDAKVLQPDEIILLGDLVDCGGFLAQHHVMGYVAETTYSYEEDIACANAFLDALQAACPNARIEYLEGNHERRVEQWCVTETLRHTRDSEMLRRVFAPEFLLHLKERGIPYYRIGEFYDGLSVPGVIKRGKCYYLHGFSTAKAAAAVTQGSIAGNVVFAHTHRAQSDIVRRVNSGVVGSWNPGCLTTPQPLWQHGKPTDWTLGYAIEFIARTDSFLHMNIPIIDGQSLLIPLFSKNER